MDVEHMRVAPCLVALCLVALPWATFLYVIKGAGYAGADRPCLLPSARRGGHEP